MIEERSMNLYQRMVPRGLKLITGGGFFEKREGETSLASCRQFFAPTLVR